MLKKKIMIFIIPVLIVLAIIVVVPMQSSNKANNNTENSDQHLTNFVNASQNNIVNEIRVTHDIEGTPEYMNLHPSQFLFNANYTVLPDGSVDSVGISLKPELMNFYKEIGFFNKTSTSVVIYPAFTQAAYGKNGFYDYYYHKCDFHCLTVNLPTHIERIFEASGRATAILQLLHYDFVSDMDVDLNPEILKKYDKVIVLHNEYVTQNEFNAITNHPNVVYLFPNALYAKVNVDYVNGTFTLVQGHGYPKENVANGFGWNLDNSQFEYDIKCSNWKFYNVTNGKMLNCYPAFTVLYDEKLLQELAQ